MVFWRASGAAEDEGQGAREQGGEERELVLRAREGDRGAFEALLARHERAVLRLAWKMLGNLEDARDASQEAFVRLYRNLQKLDPEKDLAPWLHRVTLNTCRDARQRRGRLAALSLDDPEGPAGGFEPRHPSDPMETVACALESRRLLIALQAVPEKERAALVLRDVEGLPTEEVARLLGSSETTVRSQVSRARLRLRKLLGREREGMA